MKYSTIKENRTFQRLYRKGKSYVSPVLVTYILKNKTNNLRIGITTGKKIGKAVQRNRCRRIIRAAYAQLYPNIEKDKGYDLIFVARTKTVFSNSREIYNAMMVQFKKAGLIK